MFLRTSIAFLLLVATHFVACRNIRASYIFTFEGESYDEILGLGFTAANRITGTVTFDQIGSTAAKAFSLTTTVGGSDKFSITVDDTNDPGQFIIASNEFDWKGTSVPQVFSLTVEGEAFGIIGGIEQLGIAHIGDFVTVDLDATTEFAAFNMAPGSFSPLTSVPEPSSFLLFVVGSTPLFFRRRHID